MKTLNQFSKGYGFLFILLCPLLMFIIGCSKQEINPIGFNGDLNDMCLRKPVLFQGQYSLKGLTGFGFYSVMEKKVLADPYVNYCECTADLTFTGRENFVLQTREFFFGMMYREVIWNGKIAPGGRLKLSWPQTFKEFDFSINDYATVTVGVLPEIRLHTGCTLYGPGINRNTLDYNGYFDGKRFYADTHFMGIPTGTPALSFLEGVKGPIKIHYLIDLEVEK